MLKLLEDGDRSVKAEASSAIEAVGSAAMVKAWSPDQPTPLGVEGGGLMEIYPQPQAYYGVDELDKVVGGITVVEGSKGERKTKYGTLWHGKMDPLASATWEAITMLASIDHKDHTGEHHRNIKFDAAGVGGRLTSVQTKALLRCVEKLKEGLIGQEIVVYWEKEWENRKFITGEIVGRVAGYDSWSDTHLIKYPIRQNTKVLDLPDFSSEDEAEDEDEDEEDARFADLVENLNLFTLETNRKVTLTLHSIPKPRSCLALILPVSRLQVGRV